MTSTMDVARARAEASFKVRAEQAKQAPLAVRDYRRAQQEVAVRTARLRAERLAREAAVKASPAS